MSDTIMPSDTKLEEKKSHSHCSPQFQGFSSTTQMSGLDLSNRKGRSDSYEELTRTSILTQGSLGSSASAAAKKKNTLIQELGSMRIAEADAGNDLLSPAYQSVSVASSSPSSAATAPLPTTHASAASAHALSSSPTLTSTASQFIARDWMLIKGTFIHSLSLTELQILQGGIMGVYQGTIMFLCKESEASTAVDPVLWESAQQACQDADNRVVDLKDGFLIPGFIDTHTHAAQYPFSGTGRIPLLQWLEKYTFPTEKKFAEAGFALQKYKQQVRRHIINGTTTCCYYATIHLEASLILAKVVQEMGQRAYIGKVCMDRNSPPDYVEASTLDSLQDTKRFMHQLYTMQQQHSHTQEHSSKPHAHHVQCGCHRQASTSLLASKDNTGKATPNSALSLNAAELEAALYPNRVNHLIQPILTPRFAPSCTSELMLSLGKLAEKHDLPIQTHVSENLDEIAWVKSLHPDCDGYADVYDKHKLLTNQTVLAHCIFLTDQEKDLVKARESGISHCPNSNFSLDSGILDVRSCLNRGIKVSLGTDVAGGYSSSILDAIRQTIIASKSLQFMHEELARREAALLPLKGVGTADHANDDTGAHTDASASDSSGTASAAQTVAVTERKALSVEESFYLATMGGARVMNLDQKVGNFLVGKQLDALVIDMGEKDLDVTASMMGHGCSDTACMHSSGDGDGGMGGGHVCPMDLNSYENVYEAFQKFIFLADDRNIQRVYINGRLVHKLK